MTIERRARSGMFYVEEGHGIPVIFVHGAFSDQRVWQPQIAACAASHRALAVSLRGYHPSQAMIEGASAQGQADDVADLIAELGEPVVLVGHSRGGRIALTVAANCGRQVDRLVLVEPGGVMAPDFLGPPTGPPQSAGEDIRPRVRRLIETGDRAVALEIYIDHGHGAGMWKRLPEWFRDMAIENAHTIGMMIDDTSVALSRQIAREVTAPTVLVCGSRSPRIFHAAIAVLHAEVRTARVETVADGDHFLTLCRTKDFNRALAGVLAA